MLNIYRLIVNKRNTIKTSTLYYHYQLCIFYWRILPQDPIIGSYNKIQHVITLDLDLVQFYSNMCFQKLGVNLCSFVHGFCGKKGN